jgi:parallel beta-helix repeat protein
MADRTVLTGLSRLFLVASMGAGLAGLSIVPAEPSAPVAPPLASPSPPEAPPADPVPTTDAAPPPAETAAPPAPAGPVRHVSVTGSDDADGSAAAPWRTIQHAVDVAPGLEIVVGPGTYEPFSITVGGGPGRPTVVRAAAPGSVVVAGTSEWVNVVDVAGAHDVTIEGLEVRGAAGTWSAGVLVRDGATRIRVAGNVLTDNRNFGIRVVDATDVVIAENRITRNDTGVLIERAGAGVQVLDNRVEANTGMLRNDGAPDNDTGAMGVVFMHTTGPTLARGNVVSGNRAPSIDYGYDGAAFEIFAASGVTIDANITFDNQNVLETGTSDGIPCTGNRFTHNVSWGGNDKSLVTPTGPQVNGLLLRCAEGMVVAHNTFKDLDAFTWWVHTDDRYSSGVQGLTVVDNVATQISAPVYSLGAGVAASVVFDRNVVVRRDGGDIAWLEDRGSTTDFDTFRAWTGLEASGVPGG